MFRLFIFFKQFQAGFTVYAGHITGQFLPAAGKLIKILVPEADLSVVLNGTAIVDSVNIGPENRVQTHGTWFSCGIQGASGQIVAF